MSKGFRPKICLTLHPEVVRGLDCESEYRQLSRSRTAEEMLTAYMKGSLTHAD
jgi:hypothetical protein